MPEISLEKLNIAIDVIRKGVCDRVDIDENVIVYKIPQGNKYTIRIDIKNNK
jgi:hypothetical protein